MCTALDGQTLSIGTAVGALQGSFRVLPYVYPFRYTLTAEIS